MTVTPLRTIAIIGAGFSGTATAIHLLRQIDTPGTRVLLIERGTEVGRGVAYARRSMPYLLNVPVSRMSATPADPDEFLRYAAARMPSVTPFDFLPRELYGDYLQSLLIEAETAARVLLVRVRDAVVDVIPELDQSRFKVCLRESGPLQADEVIIATGHPPPASPFSRSDAAAALLRDPWDTADSGRDVGPVLLLGTGLTMADVVQRLVGADPLRQLVVLSRHGLLPERQAPFRAEVLPPDLVERLANGRSARQLVRQVRGLARAAMARGADWREVVNQVRHLLPRLWGELDLEERSRFLRHARAYWDVHRHRLPELTHRLLLDLRSRGQLQVYAGRPLALEETATGVRVTWRPRGQRQSVDREVAAVINCTGPDYRLVMSEDPLWRALLSRGLAATDPLGLGLLTSREGHLLDSIGRLVPHLYYVGPLLRADHWEATAVGELRVHAQNLARHLSRTTSPVHGR